jgi:hypothetical protein
MTDLPSESKPAPHPHAFPFLDLPADLRFMVYKNMTNNVTERTIPIPSVALKYHQLNTSLFSCCTLISREAHLTLQTLQQQLVPTLIADIHVHSGAPSLLRCTEVRSMLDLTQLLIRSYTDTTNRPSRGTGEPASPSLHESLPCSAPRTGICARTSISTAHG